MRCIFISVTLSHFVYSFRYEKPTVDEHLDSGLIDPLVPLPVYEALHPMLYVYSSSELSSLMI